MREGGFTEVHICHEKGGTGFSLKITLQNKEEIFLHNIYLHIVCTAHVNGP